MGNRMKVVVQSDKFPPQGKSSFCAKPPHGSHGNFWLVKIGDATFSAW